jgi:hypothetical protein
VTSEFTVKKVGIFNQFSTTIWKFFEPGILYSDGTPTPPSDIEIEDWDCPFNEDDAETFHNGLMLAYLICFALCIVTIIMTVLIWRKWWNREIKPLGGKHFITLNDMIIIAIVFIDFCQYLAMGPRFRSLNAVIWELSSVTSVDLSGLIEMSEGVFWMVLNIVYALCFVWFVVSVLVLLKVDIKYESSAICRNFGYWAEFLLPMLSNM